MFTPVRSFRLLLLLAVSGCAFAPLERNKLASPSAPQAGAPASLETALPNPNAQGTETYPVQQAGYEPPPPQVKTESAVPTPVPADAPGAVPPTSSTEPSELPPPSGGSSKVPMPLDFASALALTHEQNPRIALAQAQISQAFAQYEASRALWLPSIRAGTNYNKHEGRLQDVEGFVRDISRGAAFGGLGAGAVGAGSPSVPGIYAQFHVTDALHQPQIAGYQLQARQQLGTAASNDQLLETALGYLSLLEALQRQAIAKESLQHAQGLADITSSYARSGEGSEADADRARAALALLQNEVVRTEESVEVASARLVQLLSLDPLVEIVPQESTLVPLNLQPVELELSELVAAGLSNRPELSASRALVCEAVNRLRREQNAPWLPSVILGVSQGAFAGGVGGNLRDGGDRFDLDAVAWWEVRNLGLGERAARDNARAQVQQARMREVETMDLVAREIVEAHSRVSARRRQIAVAERGIDAAQQSYERNLKRIRNGQGLPIETLQSIQALDAARRDYLRAVADFNQAQFQLQRALGWPIAE